MRNVFSLSRAFAVASLALIAGSAEAAGVFTEFGGAYRGAGRIYDTQGKTEPLSCKSNNAPSSDGIAMQLSLVCASDSYKVDFHADLYTDGQALHGNWTETTRGASGDFNGTISPMQINANASAPGFNAAIVIRVVKGGKLDVVLNSTGTSISRVTVVMKK